MAYPSWLAKKYRNHWDHPWRSTARRSVGFRAHLLRHKHLSPHFTLRESSGAEYNRQVGNSVPRVLQPAAQAHAFKLEQLRHEIGDRPVRMVGWYRSPRHNRAVGGAALSKHRLAIATDHPKEWVDAVGRQRVMRAAEKVFAHGGVGVYPGGNIHLDNRSGRARWSSWVPGR
jgi:zinc D-Ala-D-Ala carboxypeptidase